MGQFEKLINWALLFGGFIGIIFPAFLDPPKTLTQILVSTTKPELTLSYAMQVLFVFMFICGAYIVVVKRIFKDVPITVLSTRISIKFAGAKGKKAHFTREQIFRANQSNVTAYHSSVQPTAPDGRIAQDKIEMNIYCEGCNFGNSFDADGSPDRGFDFIHEFGRPLPYRWYMPLIPLWLISHETRGKIKAIKNNLPIRTQYMLYEDDFTHKPSFELTAGHYYAAMNIEVELDFAETDVPRNVRCRIIKSNGVIEGSLRRINDRHYIGSVDRLSGDDSFKITWEW